MTERERNLKRRYNLTIEEYDEWFDRQAGRCAICHVRPDHNLCVDHCHETGIIRGLLCHSCNRGIGLLGDDLSRLRSAVGYLFAHELRLAGRSEDYDADC